MFKGKKVIGYYEGLDEILTAYIASGLNIFLICEQISELCKRSVVSI
jgi:hypothetical protein